MTTKETYTLRLSQRGTIEKLAELYGVEPTAVHVHIEAAYNGGPTDSSPGSFSITIDLPADRVRLAEPKTKVRAERHGVPAQLKAWFMANPGVVMTAEELVDDGHIDGEARSVRAKLNMLVRENFLCRTEPAHYRLAPNVLPADRVTLAVPR